MPENYRIFVNEERTVAIEMWPDDPQVLYVKTRKHPSDTWGPPVKLTEET